MTTGNTPNFAKQPETQHDAELQRSTNREHSSDVEEIIRKEVEVFKWCDEHPDELVKKCLEYEPDLQLSSTSEDYETATKAWEEYERKRKLNRPRQKDNE